MSLLLRALAIVLVASFCGGCALFYRQPALPGRAAIESRDSPQADDEFARLVHGADIIYLPSQLLGTPLQSAPVSKVLNALQRSGSSFAIGCDLIGGEEQALLDRWVERSLTTRNLISRLHLSGTARQRENCRTLLHEMQEWGARFLALRCLPDSWATTASEPATGPGVRSWNSRSFRSSPGDFQRFAERFAPARDPDENALRAAYERALRAEEFAAERIIGNFQRHRAEKLLVFAHRRHFENGRGVPYFVAQKIKARQLVLDSQPGPSESRLLAWSNWSGVSRGFEIIDRSPIAGGDQL